MTVESIGRTLVQISSGAPFDITALLESALVSGLLYGDKRQYVQAESSRLVRVGNLEEIPLNDTHSDYGSIVVAPRSVDDDITNQSIYTLSHEDDE